MLWRLPRLPHPHLCPNHSCCCLEARGNMPQKCCAPPSRRCGLSATTCPGSPSSVIGRSSASSCCGCPPLNQSSCFTRSAGTSWRFIGGVRPRRAREIPVLPRTNVNKLEFCYSVTGPITCSSLLFHSFDGTHDEPHPRPSAGATDSLVKKMKT